MSALPWSTLKEDGSQDTLSQIAIGHVVFTSLRSRAATESRVMAICKQQVRKQPKDVAGPLRNIIRQASVPVKNGKP